MRDRSEKNEAARSQEPGKDKPARRRRMAPSDRERMILAEARRYFAEYGLSGGTTALARRIGITQPLLYRYFPTKDALIEKVYEGLFPSSRTPEWEALLSDPETPLRDRLKRFYKEFSAYVFTYDHVRLFLYSGLEKLEYNARHYERLTRRLFRQIALAIRETYADPQRQPPDLPVTEAELELVQNLHAMIYNIAHRRWVHTPELNVDKADIDRLIEFKVDSFLDGVAVMARNVIPERQENPPPAASGNRN